MIEGIYSKYDSWEREKVLKNTKEVIVEFEEKLNAEVKRQEKLDKIEKRDFRRGELLEKYIVRMLYR